MISGLPMEQLMVKSIKNYFPYTMIRRSLKKYKKYTYTNIKQMQYATTCSYSDQTEYYNIDDQRLI